MTPRPPKPISDGAPTTAAASPLKPKTDKAKVEKVRADKGKSGEKAKAAAKGEKIEKAMKAKAVKTAAAAVAVADKDEKDRAETPINLKATAVKKEKVTEKDGAGKEKVKPVNGDEAIELIARYLKSQNRPYSATEVSANLHGKTVADKLLKEMEQSGLIMAKATNGTNKGSQWVFWAIQDPADAATPEELSAMETSIVTLRGSLPLLKSSLKALGAKLHTIKSATTTTELAVMVDKLRAEIKLKDEKLKAFAGASVKTITKEEADRVEKEFKYWGTKRRARINAYRNLEGHLLFMGMSKEDIKDKVGVEPDTYDA